MISLSSFTSFHGKSITPNQPGTPDVILHILAKDHLGGCCSYRGLVNRHILRDNVCFDMCISHSRTSTLLSHVMFNYSGFIPELRGGGGNSRGFPVLYTAK
jgi:hypothetical protein